METILNTQINSIIVQDRRNTYIINLDNNEEPQQKFISNDDKVGLIIDSFQYEDNDKINLVTLFAQTQTPHSYNDYLKSAKSELDVTYVRDVFTIAKKC